MNTFSIRDIFIGLAERYPNRLAVESANLTLTYSEFIARASRSARHLQALGVRPGAKVGLAARNSAEAMVGTLALWMLGATVVPMDFRTRPSERAAIAREFDLFSIVEDRQADDRDYASILTDASWSDTIAKHPDEPPRDYWDAAPAFIALTSGTTGKAVGVVVDHDRLLARVMLPLELGRKDSGGRLFNPIPLSFGLSIHNTLGHMINGGTVIFYAPVFGTEELAEAILSSDATSVCAVPTIVRGLLELYGDRAQPVFEQLRLFYCSGAPIEAREKRLARSVLTPNFVELYASQVGGRITLLDSEDIDSHADTVGRVLPQVSLQIVDEADNPLPRGEEGLIRVRSPGMARSTYGGVVRAAGDRLKDGWVYTGEIGAVDSDGFLRLLGRDSDVIIRGGENIHPSEVESVVMQIPGVRDAAAVGFAVPRVGEELAVFVVTDGNVTEPDLVANLRALLASNKRPRRIVLVTEIPRNANGKILRSKLRERLDGEA